MPLTADRPDEDIAPRLSPSHGDYVCWTRMQSEAGQGLDEILARKERERLAGQGLFLWGVGNAPAVITSVLARASIPVKAVFSIMKSRPKPVDVAPARLVAWRRYIDADGVERDLPAHALVTSRGDSATGAKRTHYALMCRSDRPLTLTRGKSFDPAAYRNAGGNGAPVGSSQVTALLRRVHAPHDGGDYETNLMADLVGSYWVRLTDAIELDRDGRAMLDALPNGHDDGQWRRSVALIKAGPRTPEFDASGPLI